MFDALVIPGGARGADTMSKHPAVQHLIRKFIQEKKIVGMICAGEFVKRSLAHFVIMRI